MSDKVLTAEELEKHLDSYNLADFKPGGKHNAAAAAGGGAAAALPNICPAYKMVRPILLIVLAFPLISKKIKDAIKAFMSVLDGICP